MKESNAGLKIWVWLLVKETDTDKNRKTCKIKKSVNELEESVTFDDIQRCFSSVIWLLMIGKFYDVVIVFRGIPPPTVC